MWAPVMAPLNPLTWMVIQRLSLAALIKKPPTQVASVVTAGTSLAPLNLAVNKRLPVRWLAKVEAAMKQMDTVKNNFVKVFIM